MTLKRSLVKSLDRNGSRWLLSALATQYARRSTNRGVAVWYDDLWIRRLNAEIHVADTPSFEYFADDILAFPQLAGGLVAAAQDF